jgi:hypothetical protein
MINKILNEYIRLYNIKDVHILKQVLQFVEFEKVLDKIAEKRDVTILYNKNNEVVNVYFN